MRRGGRGRQGPVPTARSLWKDLASPGPRSCTDSASPLSLPPQRSKPPPSTPCLGLARLSASAGRRVPRLPSRLERASPSSTPPSVSRRDGHLSRSLSLSVCPSLPLSQLLRCPPQACRPARCLPLGLPLPSFVSVAAYPGIPPPDTRLPPDLCVSVSVGLPHSPRAPGAPLRDSLPPILSGATPAPAPSTQAWQTPFSGQVTMKTLATRKPRAFPAGMEGGPALQLPTPSLGESRDTPLGGC